MKNVTLGDQSASLSLFLSEDPEDLITTETNSLFRVFFNMELTGGDFYLETVLKLLALCSTTAFIPPA